VQQKGVEQSTPFCVYIALTAKEWGTCMVMIPIKKKEALVDVVCVFYRRELS
jgi:hypothetical protein